MKKHWQYLKYVLKHKWHTFKAARALGITWLGIIHDWTKFLPSEWFAYVNWFYDKRTEIANVGGQGALRLGKRIEYCGQAWAIAAKDDCFLGLIPWEHKENFDRAWLHHQKSNRHHWQYYLLQYDTGSAWGLFKDGPSPAKYFVENYLETGADVNVIGDKPILDYMIDRLNLAPVALPMPDRYRREMLADWRGAGMAINGKDETAEWYVKNRENIILHPETRAWIEEQLGVVLPGYTTGAPQRE